MDTRKTTLIATVVIIALLAVGIGYAYTAYSQNGGNSTDKAYITLTQTGETGYKFANNVKVEFDTYNETDTQTIYYRLVDRNTLSLDATGFVVSVLGKITLQADWEGSTNPPSKLNVYVPDSTDFSGTENWNYFITSEPNVNNQISTIYAYKDTASTASSEWTNKTPLQISYNDTTHEYDPVTICVCYGYKASLETLPEGPGTIKFVGDITDCDELNGAMLLFKAVSVANVTLNVNNTQSQAQPIVNPVEAGTSYNLPAAKPASFDAPDGKHFLGWNTDKNATQVLSGPQKIKEDITYYAIWVDD